MRFHTNDKRELVVEATKPEIKALEKARNVLIPLLSVARYEEKANTADVAIGAVIDLLNGNTNPME